MDDLSNIYESKLKESGCLWTIIVTFSSAIKKRKKKKSAVHYIRSFKVDYIRRLNIAQLAECLKTTTRGSFSEPRHHSQRLACQITNACSITLTCQNKVINIAVGKQGQLGSSLEHLVQTQSCPAQNMVVNFRTFFKSENLTIPNRLLKLVIVSSILYC